MGVLDDEAEVEDLLLTRNYGGRQTPGGNIQLENPWKLVSLRPST